jgi:hypothetical protein
MDSVSEAVDFELTTLPGQQYARHRPPGWRSVKVEWLFCVVRCFMPLSDRGTWRPYRGLV